MEIISFAVGGLGLLCAAFFAWRLWYWKRRIAGVRIAVAYKRRVKLQAPLSDWLKWARMLRQDEGGRTVYLMGGTTVAILKPRPASHGKAKTRTIKEKQAA